MRTRPAQPLPGIEARYSDVCTTCKGDIEPGDRVFYRRGRPVHVGCQSGADDV